MEEQEEQKRWPQLRQWWILWINRKVFWHKLQKSLEEEEGIDREEEECEEEEEEEEEGIDKEEKEEEEEVAEEEEVEDQIGGAKAYPAAIASILDSNNPTINSLGRFPCGFELKFKWNELKEFVNVIRPEWIVFSVCWVKELALAVFAVVVFLFGDIITSSLSLILLLLLLLELKPVL